MVMTAHAQTICDTVLHCLKHSYKWLHMYVCRSKSFIFHCCIVFPHVIITQFMNLFLFGGHLNI